MIFKGRIEDMKFSFTLETNRDQQQGHVCNTKPKTPQLYKYTHTPHACEMEAVDQCEDLWSGHGQAAACSSMTAHESQHDNLTAEPEPDITHSLTDTHTHRALLGGHDVLLTVEPPKLERSEIIHALVTHSH